MVNPVLDPLSRSLERQTDIKLLKEGTPSLLLMLDGLIDADPKNKKLLVAGSRAYSFYATVLGEYDEKERAAAFTVKAKQNSMRLLERLSPFKKGLSLPVEEFEKRLKMVQKKDVDFLFWGAQGWAAWVWHQDGAPAAMVDLPRIEQIMLRVLELDEGYYYGSAHLFLGAYYGAIPKAFGGRPESSREHFEKALLLSERRFLLTQVYYAETYARMSYNRDLFEKLLKEVMDAPEAINEMSSANQLAKLKAARLLGEIDDTF